MQSLRNESQPPEADDLERRAALIKLGQYAALVPPVVLTLLVSSKASVASPLGNGNPPGEP